MRRSAGTAMSALTGLDPLRSAGPEHRTQDHGPAEAVIDRQIARILAVPRDNALVERTKSKPSLTASHRNRLRYGALGLVASAALAVIATLLWVSPSAGAPTAQANAVFAGMTHYHLPGAGSLATNAIADKGPCSATGTAIGR
jgi:hypothetical protein